MNYNIITIAPTIGSYHPFIIQSKVDIYFTIWHSKGLTKNCIEKMIDVFQKWIYNSKLYNGTNARVATKSGHNDIIFETVLRDVYNRKQDCKELCMFSIGGDFITGNNKWEGQMSHTKLGKHSLLFPKYKASDWPIMEKLFMKISFP